MFGYIRLLFFTLFISEITFCQNFAGQWKGEFLDKSSAVGNFSGEKCDYVLELEIDGNTVSGSSYTYFTEGGKRFYTICKLEGWIDSKKKYIEIEETSRVKTNIPSNIRNCFQTHKLTYFKKGDEETLEGNWVPAPHQQPGCGFGTTRLSKRTLSNSFASKPDKEKKRDNSITNETTSSKTTFKPSKKTYSDSKPTEITQSSKDVTPGEIINTNKDTDNKIISKQPHSEDLARLEKRKVNLIKTIEIESNHFDVDFYDNGEIDGDTVSVYYNNKPIISKKRLTDRPLHVVIDMDEDVEVNELIMYAENLGTIPPNSAVMIVHDGPHRYEVRISSDLNNSGVIRFIHKK